MSTSCCWWGGWETMRWLTKNQTFVAVGPTIEMFRSLKVPPSGLLSSGHDDSCDVTRLRCPPRWMDQTEENQLSFNSFFPPQKSSRKFPHFKEAAHCAAVWSGRIIAWLVGNRQRHLLAGRPTKRILAWSSGMWGGPVKDDERNYVEIISKLKQTKANEWCAAKGLIYWWWMTAATACVFVCLNGSSFDQIAAGLIISIFLKKLINLSWWARPTDRKNNHSNLVFNRIYLTNTSIDSPLKTLSKFFWVEFNVIKIYTAN